MRIKNKTLFSVILILFILGIFVVATFLCLECFMRFRLYLTEKFNILAGFRIKANADYYNALETPLWEIMWSKYKKNIEIRKMLYGAEIQVKLNNYGYRTKDIKVPKPRGKYRILCIGGSTTLEGRTNELTYPSLLEKKLNKYFQSENIEIYNCGISGLNSEGERNKMDDFLTLEPDLIIEYNLVNDIFWVMERNKQERTNRNVIYKSLFLDNTFFKLKDKEVATFLISFTIPNLEIMHQKAQSHNVKIAFCSFIALEPSRLKSREKDFFEFNIRTDWKSKFITFNDYCNYTKIYNQYLKKMCEENNILFIPLAENFNPIMNDFWDICHLSEQGREKKVDIISEFLIPFLTTEINSRHPASTSPVSSSREAQLPR